MKKRIGFWARRFGAERRGATAVEFALVLPLLLMILFGIVQFGITFNNYIQLTDAVRVGARNLAVSRTSSTPYSTTTSAITSSAPTLTAASISPTVTINGTACTSDSTCKTAMSTAAGLPASVTATYPCNLVVMGVNYGPGCTLSATTTEMIE
jgi:Flp pilus assembly protein TadG